MRPLRICIYGGTDLQDTPIDFVERLAHELLRSLPSVIVTGGFVSSEERSERVVSTDIAAWRGACRHADEAGVDRRSCYVACVPDPSLDDERGVRRMSEREHDVTIEQLRDRTPLGRRLAMVRTCDVVVTITGGRHTEVVIEQAIECGLPTIPIPHSTAPNGKRRASARSWKRHRVRLAAAFPDGRLTAMIDDLATTILDRPDEGARSVVDLVREAKIGKCLVLMPFDAAHDDHYERVVRPTIQRHMHPVRLDHEPGSRPIADNFADGVSQALAIVADITEVNENVMYEIGYAHSMGFDPLLFARDVTRIEHLPVYFRSKNVHPAMDDRDVARVIDEHLRQVKAPHLARSNRRNR